MEEKKVDEILNKQPKEKCIENFKKYILKSTSESSFKSFNNKNKDDLISIGLKGELSSIFLRPLTYKIFLDLFPLEKSIQQWISITFNHRLLYSQLKSKYFNKKKEIEDETEKMIKLDLTRTFPEINAFNQNKIINILYNVLHIYAKEYSINYKQGMNEIISILFISLYPYYFPNAKSISKIEIINAINSININCNNYKLKKYNSNFTSSKKFENKLNNINININKNGYDILYNFFHDENYLEVDLYFIFTNLMNKGFANLYQDNMLQKRCNDIIKNKLNIIDVELYKYCIKINLASEIFLEKWILSFFDRYTSIQNCISILDIILSNEFENKKDDKFNLDIIDNICLSMLINYKKELLQKNDEEFLIFCLCYPKIENIQDIFKLLNFIKLTIPSKESHFNIEKKLSVRINPKKPKYNMNSSKKLNNKNTLYNNDNHGISQTFIESKSIKKHIFKNIGIKDQKDNEGKTLNKSHRNIGTLSSSNIKQNKLNINKKENEGFKLSFGNLFNPKFEDVKTDNLIDLYYF